MKFILTICVFLSLNVQADVLHFGVLSFRPKEITMQQWKPLAVELERVLSPQYTVELLPMTYPELDLAVKNKQIDILLTNPEHYVLLKRQIGANAIATIIGLNGDQPSSTFSGVIFTSVNRKDINSLADLNGKIIAAPSKESLGAYLMQRWELEKRGIHPKGYDFVGMPHDKAVDAVIANTVDAGFVRSGVLEDLQRAGQVVLDGNQQTIKVLSNQATANKLKSSTDSYPEWALSTASNLDRSVVQKIALAVLSIDSHSEIAHAANIAGFTPPADYTSVELLMLRLNMHPEEIKYFNFKDVLWRYQHQAIVIFLVLITAILSFSLFSNHRLKKLQLQNNKLLLAIEKSPVLVVITDLEHKIEYVNSSVLKKFGYQFHELVGKHISEFNFGEKLNEIQSSKLITNEVCFYDADGKNITFNVTVNPIYDNNNQLIGYTKIAQDITKLKQQSWELEHTVNRLRMATKIAEIGIWTWNKNTNEIKWDSQMFEIYGIPINERPEIIFYDFWRTCVHPDDVEFVESRLDEQINQTGHYESVFRIMLPNKEIRYISAIADSEKDYQGNILQLVGINRDVTASKLAELKLTEAKYLADSANKAKSEFLANMSHEIRTPMNAIIGFTEICLEEEIPENVKMYLSKVRVASWSLLSILNDILDYSKIELGKLPVRLESFDLKRLLSDLYNIYSISAQDKHLEFECKIDEHIPLILIGDSLRIRQVLVNLVSNAIKFTSNGKIIVEISLIEFQQHKVKLRFSVSDTGIGIEQDNHTKIFDSFYQIDSCSSRAFGGVGLGLSISQNLLGLMNTHLVVDSELGRGAVFYFDLNLETEKRFHKLKLKNNMEQVDYQLYENAKFKLSGLKVLLVEDDILNQEVMALYFDKHNVIMDKANNGFEALERLKTNTYDAVLMDINMPVMNGIDATKQIRMNPTYRKLPIIALTAGAKKDQIANCFSCGMNEVLTKPIDTELLALMLIDLVDG